MKGSGFIFDSAKVMYYKCHKESFIRGGSYIDSLHWIKKKKATINPKNTNDKCFQYAATVVLNYEEKESHPERFWSTNPFINKYNWEGVNYPSIIDDWKTFEKNNPTITLNILCTKEKEICPAYISKINLNCEKQIILSMIPNEEKEGWHWKQFSCNKKCFYIIKRNNIKTSWWFLLLELPSFLLNRIVMRSEKDDIVEFNQYTKSDKMLYIIYADI